MWMKIYEKWLGLYSEHTHSESMGLVSQWHIISQYNSDVCLI